MDYMRKGYASALHTREEVAFDIKYIKKLTEDKHLSLTYRHKLPRILFKQKLSMQITYHAT